MRKQDHLIQLIHSLSPSEKKYFRQYISARQDSKGYEKLFDVLHRSGTYDADAVSTTLKKSKKNLADDKEYLQEILLKALHSYHSGSMYRARCFSGLVEADIMANKGMPEFALARIRKLKKTMLPGEENLLYYMVLAQESNLTKSNIPGGLKVGSDAIIRDNTLLDRLEAIWRYNKLVHISVRILDLSADIKYLGNPSILRKAAALVQEAHEVTKGQKLSSVTHTTYHKMLAEYYLFLGVDTKLAVYHCRKILARIQSETEEYRAFYLRDEYRTYADLIQAYFELRDYRNAEICLRRISQLTEASVARQVRTRAEHFLMRMTMLLHTATGRYGQALAFIDDGLAQHPGVNTTEEDRSVVELIRAVNLFHLGRYDESLKALLPLLGSAAPPQLPETRITARALNLMIQYELGNINSLPDYIRASDRFFRNEKLMTKEVRLFLDLMHQLYRQGGKAPVMEFQKRLEEVYANHRFELIGHFVLLPWLKRFQKT